MGKIGEEGVFDLLIRLKSLNEIGIALSAEKDSTRLLEMILEKAMSLTLADGGTLYTRTSDDKLKFEILLTDSLDVHKGGTSDENIELPPLFLYNDLGEPNCHMVAVCVAVMGTTINVPDIYDENVEFEFSATMAFDQIMGYHTKSILTVPMKNSKDEVIGVLQLVNAVNTMTGEVDAFDDFQVELVESLASQAAIALENQRLIENQQRLIKEQRRMFEGFIELTAKAIDEKSPYTAGHCRRVPELTLMLADAAADTEKGPLATFSMTEEERYSLIVASWLHDCGKIVTPGHVIDKATKLETIFDRIELIDTRYEVLKRDAEIKLLREQLAAQARGETVDQSAFESGLNQQIQELDEERDFIRQCNKGTEFMSEDLKMHVHECAKRQWISPEGEQEDFLTENEVYNLNITKGTLTAEERKTINYHIEATINMLESLPYPEYMKNVPEYAGGHHERMDGKGYPKGLKRGQLSIPARIMGIADIFEALTAKDRPYKKPMTISRALRILGLMKEDNHIDPDLFEVFIREKVYMQYAEKFLGTDQIDEVDVHTIPGYDDFYQ